MTTGNPIGVLAISPDRMTVARETSTTTVNLYNAATRRARAQHHAAERGVVSGDGKLLAIGEEAYGDNVQIFNVSTGTLVRTLPGDPNGFVQGVAFAPNGSLLASGSGFTHLIQLWNPTTGALVTSYDRETGWGPSPQLPLAFAPSSAVFGYGRGDATVVLARTP